ncbi:MAG: hypothetical protein WCT99_14220 [Bacteroidota bacterium]|jgi:hypothetical protein
MKTKRTLTAVTILFALGLFLTTTDAFAQNVGKAKQGAAKQTQAGTTGRNFVDADGDGICDNDVDKDGIPNRNDADFVRPMDGTGKKMGKANGYGNANGSGNQGIGPRDGSGYGAKSGSGTGTGTCDGTGPKGGMNRGGRK